METDEGVKKLTGWIFSALIEADAVLMLELVIDRYNSNCASIRIHIAAVNDVIDVLKFSVK